MEESNELSEAGIEQRAGDRKKWYDAEYVLLSVRPRLAIRCANAHRDAAHQVVCWWVDAAMAAWKSAVHGTPVQYARLGAAAPDTLMLPDGMTLLPDVDEHTRKLVELGAFLGTPSPGAAPDSDDGFAAMTTDLAARSGLSIRRNEMGGDRCGERRRPGGSATPPPGGLLARFRHPGTSRPRRTRRTPRQHPR
ncbi:hypothetical protein [Streptomyces sp. NPDC005879]|uniref:hypothetical protein n=1 Tax=Streptomyces sp. NPDC005879 TaxID=3154567 RepID=UPI0033FA8FA8